MGDSRLTLSCAAWKGWTDLISELQGTGAGQGDPRQESHRGGCGLARDLDCRQVFPGPKSPRLHCHTAALCWPNGHYAQAARPGPLEVASGGHPPQEAHGAARIFIVLKAQTASQAPKSRQCGGGKAGRPPAVLSPGCLDHLRRALPRAWASLCGAGSCAVGSGPSPS